MNLSESIVSARKAAGMSQTKLAEATGFSRSAVVQWERGIITPRENTLAKIAEVTGKPLSFFGGDVVEDDVEGGVGLMVIGRAAAGIWKEGNVSFKSFRLPVAPHPGYPVTAQRLWEIEGTSINRQAVEGEYLHTVSIADAGLDPADGDLVIVRRMEHGMAEYTAKLLSVRDGEYRLRPDSTDPQWQGEFTINGDESTEVHILDIVIGKYQPLGRGRRV